MDSKKLILGEGLLGGELIKQTNWNYLSRKTHNLDIFDTDSYFNELKKYDVIINCIACTKTYSTDKQEHWDINYKFVDILSEFCRNNNKKLVHISTDHVYAGSVTNASENDIPVHIRTWYGYTKLLGDALIQLKVPDHLLIRTSHKPYPFPYKEAWVDQITNGDYVTNIASIIVELINKNQKGVINVGTELKTWYSQTKEEFKTLPIRKMEQAPMDVSMNLSKLKSII